MTVLERIEAWTGCNKQYWEGVAIVRDHGQLSEREERLLMQGMKSCKQEEIITAEIARIRANELAKQPKPRTKPRRKAEAESEEETKEAAE